MVRKIVGGLFTALSYFQRLKNSRFWNVKVKPICEAEEC